VVQAEFLLLDWPGTVVALKRMQSAGTVMTLAGTVVALKRMQSADTVMALSGTAGTGTVVGLESAGTGQRLIWVAGIGWLDTGNG
jgi:hypothetical protein